jgi:hypothetical protein
MSLRVPEQEVWKKLEGELERLKRLLGIGYELKVVWLPENNSKLSGEVKGETIYIYEEDYDKAIETLRHEFIDYAVSQIIEPYKQVANMLIAMINEDAYKRKEKLVERLRKLV